MAANVLTLLDQYIQWKVVQGSEQYLYKSKSFSNFVCIPPPALYMLCYFPMPLLLCNIASYLFILVFLDF